MCRESSEPQSKKPGQIAFSLERTHTVHQVLFEVFGYKLWQRELAIAHVPQQERLCPVVTTAAVVPFPSFVLLSSLLFRDAIFFHQEGPDDSYKIIFEAHLQQFIICNYVNFIQRCVCIMLIHSLLPGALIPWAATGFAQNLCVLQSIGKFERQSGEGHVFVLVLALPLFDHRFPR
jgi:hypothetical protein